MKFRILKVGWKTLSAVRFTLCLTTYMKLHLTNADVGMWNAEGWSRCALSL